MNPSTIFTIGAALTATIVARAEPQSLMLTAPSGSLPGIPVLVRVEALDASGNLDRDLWDAEATLAASPPGSTVSPTKVKLWNGVGSALVNVGGTGDITITASLGAVQASRVVRSLAGVPMSAVTGNVPGPVTEWSGVIHVTGTVTVPAGVTLRLLPGTLVLVDGVLTGEVQPGECRSVSETPTKCGKSIHVLGTVESMGTEEEPVVITSSVASNAWGEIHHDNASPSFYENTIISRAGNSPRGGHTNTGPSIRTTDSKIRFERCSLSDAAGKAMQATGSDLEFHECLITRTIMGPEIEATALIFDRSYSLELYGSDDNDGIYLHSQRVGQVISLTGCVIASGDDDGVDTLGSKITVTDCIIRDFANPNEDAKGMSVFSGEVTVEHCLVVGNKVGISAKSQNGGTATVRIERTSILDSSEVGLQAQDKFGEPDLRIRIFMNSSITRGADAVKTDYPKFPDDIQITYSDLSEAWTGAGNVLSDPMFVSASTNDFHLQAGSPCVDSGDPSIPVDTDGTRADMGFYPFPHAGTPIFARGRVNGDSSVDISDTIALLLHLFGGVAIGCEKAADVNDDGGLNVSDATYLLNYLFRDGPVIPAPAATCSLDPTDDGLECASPTCG